MGWSLAGATAEFLELSAVLAGEAGLLAPVIVAAAFLLAALVVLPRPLLCVISGAAFGWWGLPLAVVSAAAGASLAFVVGRRLLRGRVESWVARRRIGHAAMRAVEQEGFRAVLLLRLGPIVPSSLQSYIFSLTSMPFRPYLAGTVIGTFPGILAQVGTGAAGRATLEGGLASAPLLLWCFGLAAFALATIFIGRRTRRLLSLAAA